MTRDSTLAMGVVGRPARLQSAAAARRVKMVSAASMAQTQSVADMAKFGPDGGRSGIFALKSYKTPHYGTHLYDKKIRHFDPKSPKIN